MTAQDFISNRTPKRDMSRARISAVIRKSRQRKRQKAAGLRDLQVSVSGEVINELRRAGELAGGSMKEQAELILRMAAGGFRRELELLAEKGGRLWIRAEPFLPYASYLNTPGASFRVLDKNLSHAEWVPIYSELSQIYVALGRRSWSRARIEAFLKRAAKAGNKNTKTQINKNGS